jgi:hypothetical protein
VGEDDREHEFERGRLREPRRQEILHELGGAAVVTSPPPRRVVRSTISSVAAPTVSGSGGYVKEAMRTRPPGRNSRATSIAARGGLDGDEIMTTQGLQGGVRYRAGRRGAASMTLFLFASFGSLFWTLQASRATGYTSMSQGARLSAPQTGGRSTIRRDARHPPAACLAPELRSRCSGLGARRRR